LIAIRNAGELVKLRRAGEMVGRVLDHMETLIAPGITTAELDLAARKLIEKEGGRPAFLGYRGYPATLCVSINDEVVHGIPGERKLETGMIVSIDVGTVVDGYYGDGARTFPVGPIEPEARRLLDVTQEALNAGIDAARQPGGRHRCRRFPGGAA
jgi:methionyl aminopeptidase